MNFLSSVSNYFSGNNAPDVIQGEKTQQEESYPKRFNIHFYEKDNEDNDHFRCSLTLDECYKNEAKRRLLHYASKTRRWKEVDKQVSIYIDGIRIHVTSTIPFLLILLMRRIQGNEEQNTV